jgi:hypothetical protein
MEHELTSGKHAGLDSTAEAGFSEQDRQASDDHLDTKGLIELVEVLRRIPPNGRIRMVEAAMTFVGTPLSQLAAKVGAAPRGNGSSAIGKASEDSSVDSLTLPRRAQIWLSQNSMRIDDLEPVFHFSPSGVEIIAHDVPGRTNKERVRSCYLLAGLKSLCSSGEAKFSDDDARRTCRDLGCYDQANHSTYVRSIGNLLVGSKNAGYELTQPGLRAAAETIKNIRNVPTG